MTTITNDAERKAAARYQRQQLKRRKSIQAIQNSSSYASPGMIIALSLGLMAAIAFFAAALQKAEAFSPVATTRHHSFSSRIFLQDWVAEMIDNELYRQEHHKEYEAAWMEKNRGAVVSRLSDASDAGDTSSVGLYPSQMLADEDREAFAEHQRDERMAFLKPEKYCADRCVATGNCDIFEDFYELSPQDVLKFCEECVLGDEEDSGCDLPEAFYEKEPPLRP